MEQRQGELEERGRVIEEMRRELEEVRGEMERVKRERGEMAERLERMGRSEKCLQENMVILEEESEKILIVLREK